MIRYPYKMIKDKIVGITAPSDTANLDTIDYSIHNIQNMGYNVIETDNVRKNEGLVSSSGGKRAEDFINLWNDKKVGYIISARGGEFLMEMLPFLDKYENILKENPPKWVQGYSDTSLLLLYLTTKYNIATIHSENLGGYSLTDNIDKNITKALTESRYLENGYKFTQKSFEKYQIVEFENLEDRVYKGYNLTEKVEYKYINGEKRVSFSGRIIGGCIDVISMLEGTKYDYIKKYVDSCAEGVIWYLDNCELSSMELYRRLWKMKELGYFNNTNGFLIGRTYSKDVEFFTFKDAILRALEDLNVPIISEVDIGHVSPQFVIVNGSLGEFEYSNKKGILTQHLV